MHGTGTCKIPELIALYLLFKGALGKGAYSSKFCVEIQRKRIILNAGFLSRDIINYCYSLDYSSVVLGHFNPHYRLDIAFRNLFKVGHSDILLKDIDMDLWSMPLNPFSLPGLLSVPCCDNHQGPVQMTWKRLA